MPFNSKHFKNINKNKPWAIKADCRWDHLTSEMQVRLLYKIAANGSQWHYTTIQSPEKNGSETTFRSFYYLQLRELFLIIQILNTIHGTSWLWNSFRHLHRKLYSFWRELTRRKEWAPFMWVTRMRKTQDLFLHSVSSHNHITLSSSCRVVSVTRTIIFSTIRM